MASGDEADELRFLQEIASYLETQELLLPASVLCSVPGRDLRDLLQAPDDDPTPSQAKQPPRAGGGGRAKRSRNFARERLQSELKQLRAQSEELEQHVVALRQKKLRQHQPAQEERLLLATWKPVVQHQLEKRARAESENAQLRRALEREMTFARTLQQAVHQFASINTKTTVNPDGLFHLTYQLPRVCVDGDDIAVFEALFGEVDAAFNKMDNVFQENGLSSWGSTASAAPSTRSSQVQMKTRPSVGTDEGSPYIEIIGVEMHPIDKEMVFKVLSQCWEQQYIGRNCVVYETAGQSKDTVAAQMHFDVFVDGERVALELVYVLKLFVERDRITYVWSGTSKADAHFPGVYIHETGWQVIQSVGANDDNGGGMSSADCGTAILTCSQLESKKLSNYEANGELDVVAAAAPLANLLVLTYEAEMVEVSALMMDLLLEETASLADVANVGIV